MGNLLAVGAQVRVEDISPELRCLRPLGIEEKNHLFLTFHCLQSQSCFEREVQEVILSTKSPQESSCSSSEGSASSYGCSNYLNAQKGGLFMSLVSPPPVWYTEQRQLHRSKHLLHRLLVLLMDFHESEMEQRTYSPSISEGPQKNNLPLMSSIDGSQYVLSLLRKVRFLLGKRYQELGSNKKCTSLEKWARMKLFLDQCEGMLQYLFKYSMSGRFLSRSCAFSPAYPTDSSNGSYTSRGSTFQNVNSKGNSAEDGEGEVTPRTVDVVLKVFSHPGSLTEKEMLKVFRMMQNISTQLRIVEEVRWSNAKSPPPANFLFYTFPLLEEEILSSFAAASSTVFMGLEEEGIAANPKFAKDSLSSSTRGMRADPWNSGDHQPPPRVSPQVIRHFPSHIYLKRPYIASSLPQRLSTRPYMALIERLFLSFQLLKAVQTLHEIFGITHGDLKPSNVMIQSSGWLVLVDLAPYKPALLPMDGLALFEYFYDTDEKRICFMAPEKFVNSQSLGEDFPEDEITSIPHAHRYGGAQQSQESISPSTVGANTSSPPLPSNSSAPAEAIGANIYQDFRSSSSGDDLAPPSTTGFSLRNINVDGHTATMDMFSLGAVLVYLFTEECPFSLSDVLTLRRLYPTDTREKQMEREDLIRCILQKKQRIQDVFSFFGSSDPTQLHELRKEFKPSVGNRNSESEEIVGGREAINSPLSDSSTEKNPSLKINFSQDISPMCTPTSRMAAIEKMILLLLSSLPQSRQSCSDLLRKHTPSIFPFFFEYLYDSVFPVLLVKHPDDQLRFFSEEMPNLLSTCVEEELKGRVSLHHCGAKEHASDPSLFSVVLRIQVSYQVISILLPSFVVALRGAATQQWTFSGLCCLHDLLLAYIPCLVQVKTVLPHFLFIIYHPEEYDARCRLLAWRLVSKVSRSYIAFLRRHIPGDDLSSTFSQISPSLVKKFMRVDKVDAFYSDVIESMVGEDPYTHPDELMESAMIFEALIFPALKFCISERGFSMPLLQEKVVLLELAEKCSSLVSMAHICLEWQHNYVYASEAKDCQPSEAYPQSSLKKGGASLTFQSQACHRGTLPLYLQSPSIDSHPSPLRSTSSSLKGIPFEKRKEEALLTLWQMYAVRWEELRENGWELFRCFAEHHVNEVREKVFSCLPEWIQVLGPAIVQGRVLPLLMREVKKLPGFKPVMQTSSTERNVKESVLSSENDEQKDMVYVARGSPHCKEARKYMLFHQCITIFALPDLLDVEWDNIISEEAKEKVSTESPVSLLGSWKNSSAIRENRSYFFYLNFFVSTGLRETEDVTLLCVVLDALRLFLYRVSSSSTSEIFSFSDNRQKNRSSTINWKKRNSALPWDKEGISNLVEIVLHAVPLLAHEDLSVAFSAAGVVVETAKALTSAPSFAIPLCRAIRPILTKPVPIILIQEPHIFPSCLRRRDVPLYTSPPPRRSLSFISSTFCSKTASTSGNRATSYRGGNGATTLVLEPKTRSPSSVSLHPFGPLSRLAYVFRDVHSVRHTTAGDSSDEKDVPSGASSASLISSLKIGVHMPLVISCSTLPLCDKKGISEPQPQAHEQDKVSPCFHVHLPILLSQVKVLEAVRLPVCARTSAELDSEEVMVESVLRGNNQMGFNGSFLPLKSEFHESQRREGQGSFDPRRQQQLLSTLRPSAVPLLTYSAEIGSAFNALVGVGHRLFFAAGTKGYAALYRWKVEGDEEEDGGMDGYGYTPSMDHRTPEEQRGRYQSSPLHESSRLSGYRYRSHHYLEVVHRFPWCRSGSGVGGGGVSSSRVHSSYPHQASENPFFHPHYSYTAAESMHDRPDDPLSSITTSSPSFVAAGTSLGDVRIFDVEQGSIVYACDGDLEGKSEHSQEGKTTGGVNWAPRSSSPHSSSCAGITSLFSLQAKVVCVTSSTGCVGLIDIRVPGVSQNVYPAHTFSSSSSRSWAWSTRIPFSKLGIPTSSCGLYHGQHAYGAVIGTNMGVCQLIDFRFQRAVQNYWFDPPTDALDCSLNRDITAKESFCETALKRAAMENVWSSTSWSNRLPSWGIQQVCMDPLGEVSHLLLDEGSLSSAPWVLLASTAGPVYRFHLSTGRYYEAFRPGVTDASDTGVSQKLWVGGVNATRVRDAISSTGLTNKGKHLHLPCTESLRVFSGGEDGHLRQWDLNDVLISTVSAINAGKHALPSPGATLNWVPSPHSFTLHRLPFYSPPYFIRSFPNKFFVSPLTSPDGMHWKESIVNSLLSSTIAERNDFSCSPYDLSMKNESENANTSTSTRASPIGPPILQSSPPPIHHDAITALTVVSGNEFQDPFSSLCLMSASRDGVLQIWRNKTYSEV